MDPKCSASSTSESAPKTQMKGSNYRMCFIQRSQLLLLLAITARLTLRYIKKKKIKEIWEASAAATPADVKPLQCGRSLYLPCRKCYLQVREGIL